MPGGKYSDMVKLEFFFSLESDAGENTVKSRWFIFVPTSSHAAVWKSSITQEETASDNPCSLKWDPPQRHYTHT